MMEPGISAGELAQRLHEARSDYEALKARIQQVGFICEGSLVERWMPCGKPNCRCVDPDQRHGPYWQLSWKQDGKTMSRRLTPDQARLYQDWIANRHQLESLVKQMQTVSRTARQHLLDQATEPTTDDPDNPHQQPRSDS